ncbi:radical SAM protein [Miltoncostaea marina]|uniref:radical SAM protein n=1 Tax=Miltoncostaea marina TaxID=2843215 RepID=UPI001C3D80A2|nr:radical SAM protein [Miltoncostaea marina]
MAGTSAAPPPGVVQVHPSLRCNLSCAHCYSMSGPRARAALPVRAIVGALEDCAALGYGTVAVSGGEPLLFADLPALLDGARAAGLRTTVTTNGTLLDARRLDLLAGRVDVLAVSLDGPPDLHDRIRGRGAFARLEAGIGRARDAGVPFGVVYTVGRSSWRDVAWAAGFAHAHGARLLQLHALEAAGRATQGLGGERPDDEVLLQVHVLTAALRVLYRGAMVVQLDLVHRDEQAGPPHPLGVLCLQDDGTLVPSTYGLDRRYAVCDVTRTRVRDAWARFAAVRRPAVERLCERVWGAFLAGDRLLVNWHEALVAAAAEGGQVDGLRDSAARPARPAQVGHHSSRAGRPA